MRSSGVVSELSLADEVFDLILEFIAVAGVMSYVAVAAIILIMVFLCSFLLDGEGSSEVDPSFISLKYFISIIIHLGVVGVPGQWS